MFEEDIDIIPKNDDGEFILKDHQMNISLKMLERFSEDKDGKELVKLYEQTPTESYDVEAIVKHMRDKAVSDFR
jgi:hypothetical protein